MCRSLKATVDSTTSGLNRFNKGSFNKKGSNEKVMSENPNPPVVQTEAELKAKITELENAKNALTGELTEQKPKIREAQEQIELLKGQLAAAVQKNNETPEEQKILSVVEKALAQRDQGDAEKNRKTAFDKFVAANKEYSPDNDPGGLKRSALERELATLKTWETAVEVDDLVGVIGKANTYLRGLDTSRQTNNTVQPYSSTTVSPSLIVQDPDADLSEQEKKLLAQNGMSKEKFLALKAKMPDFIETLLLQVR